MKHSSVNPTSVEPRLAVNQACRRLRQVCYAPARALLMCPQHIGRKRFAYAGHTQASVCAGLAPNSTIPHSWPVRKNVNAGRLKPTKRENSDYE